MDSFIQAEEDEKDENGKSLTNEATPQSPGLGLPTGQKSGSGTFTNLRDYLSANQKRVKGISDTLVSGVRDDANKIRSDIASTRDSTLGDQSALGLEKSRLAGAETGIDQTIAGAGQAQPQGLDLSKFHQFSSGKTSYAPETLDFGKQKLSVDEYEQRIGRLGQPGGQFGALQSYLNKGAPGYTRGQSRLDQALLSRDPNVRIDLNAAAQAGKAKITEDSYENIQNTYADQVKEAETRRNQLSEYTSGTGQGLTGEEKEAMKASGKTDAEILQADITRKYGKLGAAGYDLESGIAQRQAAEVAAQDALRKSMAESFGGPNADYALSQADIDRLGIQDLMGSDLYDIAGEIPTYGYNPSNPEFSQMASPQDLARAQALAKLAGGDVGDGQFDLLSEYGGVFDPSKVTAEGYKDSGFGREAFGEQIKDAQNRYTAGQDFYVKQQQAMVGAEQQAFDSGVFGTMGGYQGLSESLMQLLPQNFNPNDLSSLNQASGALYNKAINDASEYNNYIKQFADEKGHLPEPYAYKSPVRLHPSEVKRLFNAKMMQDRIAQGTLPQYYEQNIKSRGPKLGVQ